MHTEAFQNAIKDQSFVISHWPKEPSFMAWRARTQVSGYGHSYATAVESMERQSIYPLMLVAKGTIGGGQHSEDGFNVNLSVARHGDSPAEALSELMIYLSEVFTKMQAKEHSTIEAELAITRTME